MNLLFFSHDPRALASCNVILNVIFSINIRVPSPDSPQLDHGRMCIDHELGNRIRRGVECLAPPRHIDSQRKFKRRCFGVHPWPVQLRQSAEILTDRPYHIGLRMSYCGGGGGGGGGGGAGAIFPDGEMR